MHNKEQLQKQAQKLQEELDKLKEQIEACDKERSIDRVHRGDYYFYYNSSGQIDSTSEKHFNTDDYRYELGNYFATRLEVVEHLKNLRIKMKLKRLALRLNNIVGANINWKDDNQNKYYLSYDHARDSLVQYWSSSTQSARVYCLCPAFLDVAQKEIGREALIEYLISEV